MRPITQTILGDNGNCLQAAFASILEVSLDTVPHFTDNENDVEIISAKVNNYLDQFDLYALYIRREPDGEFGFPPMGYYIMIGPSERSDSQGNSEHAVVGFEGKEVHDPHPDSMGIIEAKEYLLFISKMNVIPGRRLE